MELPKAVRMHAIYSNDNKEVVTPISTIFRAATEIVNPYMADTGVAWVWLTFPYSIHVDEFLPQSQAYQQFGIMATRSRLG